MNIIRPVTLLLSALTLSAVLSSMTYAATGIVQSFCKALAEEIRNLHRFKHKFGMSRAEAKI